ncbi:probable G-protein coupled receptor 158 isoform X1 [Neodiprion lecontei]|uniref:Probable G-protein coupled receptor 158 isoform X1 n=1 Tax=Neodiprion lecontei TaxID=441921 RepID=A0ABM3G929_NEOLC|nr:probable G-protein coupled receptor 158 isoform X1 [Neodiprion lecontei]
MNLNGYWTVVILFSLICEILPRSACGIEVQIERPKELVRHQQKHRPPFIERKLVQDTRFEKLPLTNTGQITLGEFEKQISGDFVEDYEEAVDTTSLERSPAAAQIRHGRSRGHFVRQIIIDDLDDGFVPAKGKRKSGSTATIRNATFIGEEASLPFLETNDTEGTNITNEFPDDRTNLTRNILQEEAVQKLGKILNEMHPRMQDVPSTREKEQLRRNQRIQTKLGPAGELTVGPGSPGTGGSLEKLRKAFPQEKKQARMDGERENATEEFGTMVHTSSKEEKRVNENYVRLKLEDYEAYDEVQQNESRNSSKWSEKSMAEYEEVVTRRTEKQSVQVDIVTRFLRIIENQHLLGENCTAGTDLNLGEGVVDRYAQERFRLEANLAVNRANMLTRLWKYAPEVMLSSEYLLHASILSMVEFDEDIFAAGNCYDKLQYRDHWLYCPFAHRLEDEDAVLVKDLAVEYKYLSNSSEWFWIARKNAERVIASNNQFSHGFHTYTHNESAHTVRVEDEILTVKYEDGRWSKPYYDCGGGNIWMLTYTVPFFGYANDTYFFKGTSGIDIDLRRVDIDQCPLPPGSTQLNIFAASDKCKKRTTECVAIPGLGFRRGSYRCVCKRGFYYPETKSTTRYYNGTVIEEEYEKLMMDGESQYAVDGVFECLPCAEGCESCVDGSPCVVSLNWLMRTAILILECCIIACLPAVVLFTWKYGNVKVVRAASPVLLRVIALGAFFIYCTTIVMYPRPNVVTCTVRVWLREIGFSLTYGALMLKTWRISVIFRVRSAKAVKITDMNLLKRLGVIVAIFSVFLMIRTLVAPPVVIVGRTADDLKAYLCRTDWWDHSFTTLEVMFLIWGIRLCIVVRKAPSEFNESRFISMAIYNEFLLSVFLNVSMLFLQSPANPDLLYIIFFCHTQLTVTLLLCLIFGSKAYMVFRGGDKEDSVGKLPGATGKFLGKSCRTQGTSNQTNSITLQQGNFTEDIDGFSDEFRRIYTQLEYLKNKNMRLGNQLVVAKIAAMQDAANRGEPQISTIQAVSSSLRLNNLSISEPVLDPETKQRAKDKEVAKNLEKRRDETVRNGSRTKETNLDAKNTNTPEITVDKVDSKEILDRKLLEGDDKGTGKDTVSESLQTAAAPVVGQEDIPDVGVEVNRVKDEAVKDKCKNKSGHARTHAIVINLDDKSRFSEEVTV